MTGRTRAIVRLDSPNRMVTKGYQKGVYERVTKGIRGIVWEAVRAVAPPLSRFLRQGKIWGQMGHSRFSAGAPPNAVFVGWEAALSATGRKIDFFVPNPIADARNLTNSRHSDAHAHRDSSGR
jgi:hypothetical protein